MKTVLILHRRRARRAEVADGPDSEADVRDRAYWSLWQHRHFPWALVDDGTPVLLLESWSSGARLTWLVEARDVIRSTAGSRDEAIEQVAHWSGEQADDLAATGYFAAGRRPDGSETSSGCLILGFKAKPIRWLGLDRPAALRIDRNGWALARVDDLATWGVDLTSVILDGAA
ncbi:hypothetical protein FE697_019525 [Mumia zhuanghuii]|uniref:Uncharacterized protein n=2 Tax=Mumia TaxID=1546255 RepID=A0ABW1QN33_9ACTN|nr:MULTISPECIES: hypothetical protein [Mumia]KAA1420071.1 hypothetical protein FE697_019525 [Mumia zhuanghuii]